MGIVAVIEERRSPSPQRVLGNVLSLDYAAGLTLLVGTVAALTWSALSPTSYHSIVTATAPYTALHSLHLASVRDFIINGAMTLFFAVVGIELARELQIGHLADRRSAFAPLVGALGGMLGTALLMLLLGQLAHSAPTRHAWGVPMATDIAFAIGIFSVAGRSLPSSLRIFLLTLAVADDVLAVTLLAVTGSTALRWPWLAALGVLAATVFRVRRRLPIFVWPFLVALAWWVCERAGVEPPLAGVLIGAMVPFTTSAVGEHLERVAVPLSTWLVLPSFAFVATGIAWHDVRFGRSMSVYLVALVLARLVGKVLGITGAVWLLGRVTTSTPPDLRARYLLPLSLTCAVGFTVPLLFSRAAFAETSPYVAATTLGLLLASAVATIVSVTWLLRLRREG